MISCSTPITGRKQSGTIINQIRQSFVLDLLSCSIFVPSRGGFQSCQVQVCERSESIYLGRTMIPITLKSLYSYRISHITPNSLRCIQAITVNRAVHHHMRVMLCRNESLHIGFHTVWWDSFLWKSSSVLTAFSGVSSTMVGLALLGKDSTRVNTVIVVTRALDDTVKLARR